MIFFGTYQLAACTRWDAQALILEGNVQLVTVQCSEAYRRIDLAGV